MSTQSKSKAKGRLRRACYVGLAFCGIAWFLAFLYVHSWGNNWVRDDGAFEAARAEQLKLEAELKQLEEMSAPDTEIYEKHPQLVRRLLESGNFVVAKDELERTDRFLAKTPYISDNHWRLLSRLKVTCMIAAAYRDFAFFDDSRKTYERAEKLLAENAAQKSDLAQSAAPDKRKKRDEDIEVARLNLINDEGIMEYLWANASRFEADRQSHFKLAEAKFHKCMDECRFYIKETGPQPTVERLAKLSASNLIELLKDVGRDSEIAALKQLEI